MTPPAGPLRFPEYRYVDLAVGAPANRNRIVELTQIESLVPPGSEAYATYFRFRDDLKAHVDRTGSVAGFRGPAYADFLPIDIDAPDLQEAQAHLGRLLARLEADFGIAADRLAVFFSGAKGFHIYVPTTLFGDVSPGFRLPEIWRAIARDLAGDVEIDLAVYDRTRLLRLPGTRHPKTGLYKRLLGREVLSLDLDELRALAATPGPVAAIDAGCLAEEITSTHPYSSTMFASTRAETPTICAPAASPLADLYAKHAAEPPRRAVAVAPRPADLEIASIPPGVKLCYRHLLRGVAEGGRDNAALRLAVYFRKEGYDREIAEAALRAWNARNAPPLADAAITEKVARVYDRPAGDGGYDFGCYDPVLDSVCDRRCHLYAAKVRGSRSAEVAAHAEAPLPVVDYREAGIAYREYVAQLGRRRVRLGLGTLDDVMRGIAPGETATLLARTSVGKTNILQHALHAIEAGGAPVLLVELEMPAVSVYERAAQMTLGISGREIEEAFADPHLAADYIEAVYRAHPRVLVCDRPALSLATISTIARRAEAERLGGARLAAIGIDYLGLLDAGRGGRDVYEQISRLARGVKDLAKDLDVAIVLVAQISRAGDQDQPVRLDMGRDSGAIEEAGDFVLGAWRPNYEQDDDFLRIRILKNRKGPLAEADFDLDKRSLRLTERPAVRVIGPTTPPKEVIA